MLVNHYNKVLNNVVFTLESIIDLNIVVHIVPIVRNPY